jgi:uncharacterized SAM-binding protein YcdF (DUF218 family)
MIAPSDVPAELGLLAARLWAFHALSDPVEGMEAIVCLGSYDLRVAEHAADLALRHPGAAVVATGAQGNWTRGVFDATEAEIFARVMVGAGVDPERIRHEPRATNIGENIAFSRDLLGYSSGERVVFVTKPQTQQRVRATAPLHWPGISARVAAPALQLDDYRQAERGLAPVVEEMVGDLERMLVYPGLGFQVPVDVPPDVVEAYAALRSAGYSRHCLSRR